MPAILLSRDTVAPYTNQYPTDTGLDDLLSSLVGNLRDKPIDDVPGSTTDLLVLLPLLPQVVQATYHATGIVKNMTGIANDICVCNALDKIANKKKRYLKVSISIGPEARVDTTYGQNGGPDQYYPLGWIQFGFKDIGWFDRQFVNYNNQLFEFPDTSNPDDVLIATYRKPDIQFFLSTVE